MSNGIFAETLAGYTEHRTYYDGQMPLEESVTTSGNTTLTRNFVGARGIEAMFLTQGGSTTTSYPLYDVHGNMVATVQKASSGTSWTIQDERSYDVWGSVRSGIATGGPRGRYCANLGHVQDDESGLVYMRARYYEPGSGRFISEDPAMQGRNHVVAFASNPTNNVDKTGYSYFVEMNQLMLDFEMCMLGNNSPWIRVRMIQLIDAMVMYAGLVSDEIRRYDEQISFLESLPPPTNEVETRQRIQTMQVAQAMRGEARAERNIAMVYIYQMRMGLFIKQLDEAS